jgi:antagonist of KipI
MNIQVRSAGFLSSVQDLGRTGFRHSGVSVGGALDSHAMRVASALVGNRDDAAGLEVTLGKLQLRFGDTRKVAWCGGGFTARIGDENLPAGHMGFVTREQELTLISPQTGARAWLAISGGIDVPVVLGSRSTDLRGNFGGHDGRALRDGDALALGAPPKALASKKRKTVSEWGAPAVWSNTGHASAMLRILRGTDWNRFRSRAHTSLVTRSFSVTAESDRMGARLDGPPLDRMDTSDLLSEAVVPGTLQVPPNGKPILLLGDCQTIGGYPKIAHVITVDLPAAAQLWPGQQVRFHEVSLLEAQTLLREREEDFARFRVGLSLHLS